MTTQINERDYNKEMKQSFIDYAMTTITDRALPDVRDGLKPVHRRILYGMKALGLTADKPHKKSARIVGDVMGKYHPHGDSSVYLAMVRLSQDFSVKMPLVDGHGNFGSIDGDEPAAMRYTEARLSKEAEWLLGDLEKGVVDFKPNYDDSEREPSVLPARYPNLLINGSEGIATGMATNIPTHNPGEVADAWHYMLTHKKPTLNGLLKHLSSPDFPMGGVIVNEEEMSDFYKKGSARIVTRGEYAVEDAPYGKKNVVFSSLPAKAVGSKTNLINHLIQKVNDKVLDEVTDIRDESSREGTRLVIELRKGVDSASFVNKLWVKTNLQDSQRLHFLVLVDGQPKTLNLFDYFSHYVTFQRELIKRQHTYLLAKTEKRLHLVEGLLHAHTHMDVVIDAIRGSKTVQDSRDCLMKGKTAGIVFRLKKHGKVASGFSFSDDQADAILAMRLQKLVGLEKDALLKEQKELLKKQSHHRGIVESEQKQTAVCIEEAALFKQTFTVPRKTKVTTQTTQAVENSINVRPVVAVLDRFGLIKLMDQEDTTDKTLHFQIKTDTASRLMLFTNKGNVHQVKCQDIPEGKKGDRGVPVQLLGKLTPDERVLYATNMVDLKKTAFIFLSEQGKGKIVQGVAFETNRSKLLASGLQDNDELVKVLPYTGKATLQITTYKDTTVAVSVKDIPDFGRSAVGNYLFRLNKGDKVVDATFN